MLTRRQFLRVGVAGAALLVAAKLAHDRWPRTHEPATAPASARPEARDVFAALVPVILAGALPAEPEAAAAAREATVDRATAAIAALPPASQAELDQLFALLTFAPSRILVAGVRARWSEASTEDVSRFLDRFRSSRFSLLQSAYQALDQLVLAAWYAAPESWGAIGYPGPPKLA